MLKEKIRKKLNSRRGTSIFFGLLLFLAASILSVVIINGAVTTVKRVASDKKAEQNYLTCSSAARVLQDAIINSKVIKTVTETKTQQENGGTKTESVTAWSVEPVTDTGTLSDFGDMLKTYVQEYVENTEKFSVSTFGEKELSISIPSNVTTEQGKNMGEVTAKLIIDSGAESSGTSEPGCYITVKLKVGTGADICQMVLTLNGAVSTDSKKTGSETSGITQKIDTTTYTWQANDIFYGEEQRKLKES